MTGKDLVKKLEQNGWIVRRINGSHHIMKTAYMVIYFPDGDGWGAEVPDLPGCQTCGDTLDEVREGTKEAIQGWIEVAREDGDPIPEPSRIVETVSVEIPV